jgi:hypothetical protein
MAGILNGFRLFSGDRSDASERSSEKISVSLHRKSRTSLTFGPPGSVSALDDCSRYAFGALAHYKFSSASELVSDRDTFESQDVSEQVLGSAVVYEWIESADADGELALSRPERSAISVSDDNPNAFSCLRQYPLGNT